MAMDLRRAGRRDEPEINFIPLIDVLLVILIFLMVTTTYQRVSELKITLPEADAEQAKQRPREVNVGIDAQGRYVIDRNVFNFTSVGALAEMLRKAAGDAKEPVIVINADANATHQSVIHVMEAARAAGIVSITFATQTPAGAAPAPAKK
jgi:biopolymer transport protein ExbD